VDRPPRIGLYFAPGRPIVELPAAAREAEALGLDELWLAEDCFLAGGPTAAATALAATDRLAVGLGLLPAGVRNPAIAAMEIATLATLHPERVRVAFGHGVAGWMEQIGARPPDRLAALETVVSAVRALLHGETVSRHRDGVTLHDVRLDAPPEHPPPILVGTSGPRGMAVARAVADGLLLPEGAGAEAIADAAQRLDGGEIAVYVWLRLDDDGERARAELVPLTRRWCEWGLYPRLKELAGLDAGCEVDADVVGRISVAGATTIILLPVGRAPQEQIARLAREVLPLAFG
jgi:alkanesulfonate monooxygenase SsuD/methylene tetrahydromethanopterin reductase-like flavin-dependent oxidoreductase (luciferase family)